MAEKIMTLLGDKDKVDENLDAMARQNVQRMTGGANADSEEEA